VIFTLSTKAAASVAAARAIPVDVMGWRVYNRCLGEVLWSEPASNSAKVTVTPAADCPKPDEPKVAVAAKEPAAPDTRPSKLGSYEIERTLEPVKPRVKACYELYEVGGRADIVLDIQSDGVLAAAHVKGAFDGTPTGRCVVEALQGLKFPAFKANKQT